jgi:hypothetical protein
MNFIKLYEKSGINTDRLIEFLEKYINTKFKNKLIILNNTSSHRNERIKELIFQFIFVLDPNNDERRKTRRVKYGLYNCSTYRRQYKH